MPAGRRHLVLVNPSAAGGGVRDMVDGARRALDAERLEYRLLYTESLDHARSEALAAAADGQVPVVMSGDGLVGHIGGALAEGDVPLGILPCGRGNDLARVLGIPRGDLDAAAALIAAGPIREIDVGEVNGRRFLGIASCGFDSDANRIANDARLIRGNLVYLYAALRAVAAWKPATFTITLDGRPRTFSGYAVAAANSKAYGGGMFIAPDAELDDGLLDVVTTAGVGKVRFLANLPKVFSGSHVENPEVTVERAAEVRIEADRPFAVYADGDHLADLPATVRVLPRALRVIAPAPSA